MDEFDLVRFVARERGCGPEDIESLAHVARVLVDGARMSKKEGEAPLEFVRLVLDGHDDEQGLARSLAEEVVREVGGAIGCHEGCTACCDYAVSALDSEADRIAARVQLMPAPERARIIARVQEAIDRGLPQLLDSERLAVRFPCPLLVKGRCSVYEERPIACRAWFGFSSERCSSLTESSPFGMLTLVGDVATYAVWQVDRKPGAPALGGGDLIELLAERFEIRRRA